MAERISETMPAARTTLQGVSRCAEQTGQRKGAISLMKTMAGKKKKPEH
jgi:hypothetical protein